MTVYQSSANLKVHRQGFLERLNLFCMGNASAVSHGISERNMFGEKGMV